MVGWRRKIEFAFVDLSGKNQSDSNNKLHFAYMSEKLFSKWPIIVRGMFTQSRSINRDLFSPIEYYNECFILDIL